jgi:tetratricopeptide (TPR) repeat protein
MGPEHPDTLNTMHSVAEIQALLGKYAESEELFLKTLEVRRRVLGPEHPFTLNTLAALVHMYQRRKQYPLAETYAAQVLAARRHAFGPEDLRTMESVVDLALAYRGLGKFAESEPLAREAMETLARKSPDAWERYSAVALLGASLSGQKKYEAAEPLLLEGYWGMESRQKELSTPDRMYLERAREWIVEL